MLYMFTHSLLRSAAEPPANPGWLEAILEVDLGLRERGPILACLVRKGCIGSSAEVDERCARALLDSSEIERMEYRLESALQLLQAAVLLSKSSHATLCKAHRRAHIICDWLGRIPEAFSHLESALDYAVAGQDAGMIAELTSDRGILELHYRSAEQALQTDLKAAQLAEAAGEKWVLATAWGNAGIAASHLGRHEESITYVLRSERLHRSMGDMEGVAKKMSQRANLLLELGELERALELAEDSLEIRELLGDSRELATGRGVLSDILTHMGRFKEAQHWLRMASEAFVELGSHRQSTIACLKSGNLALLLGDAEIAEREYRRALEMADSAGAEGFAADAFSGLALLELLQRQTIKAQSIIASAFQRPQTKQQFGHRPLQITILGWTHYFLADARSAGHCFQEACSAYGQGDPHRLLHAGLAQIALDKSDFVEAQERAMSAMEYGLEGDPGFLLAYYFGLSVLIRTEVNLGNSSEASALLQDSQKQLCTFRKQGALPMPLHRYLLEEMSTLLKQFQTG